MLIKQPQKKPHEDDPRGKDETHEMSRHRRKSHNERQKPQKPPAPR